MLAPGKEPRGGRISSVRKGTHEGLGGSIARVDTKRAIGQISGSTVRIYRTEVIAFNNSFDSGDKTLDGYQKKKYVCKLLFIFLLGNDIDFGHMEVC